MKLRKAVTAFMVALLTISTCVMPAFGAVNQPANVQGMDSAGNGFSAGESIVCVHDFLNDYYAAGSSIGVQDSSTVGSMLLAGSDISIGSSRVGASLRSASRTLKVSGTNIAGNITSAGQYISIGSDVKARGIYLAAQDVVCGAKCQALGISAQNVTLTGSVQGDVGISADNVTVGKNTVITGTLKVVSSNEPKVEEGAQIGNLQVVHVESNTNNMVSSATAFYIFAALYTLFALIIVALVLALVVRKPIKQSGEIFRKRAGWVLLSGLVFMAAAPLAFVFLCTLVITMPLACILGLVCFLLAIVALPFTAASVGQMVFPKMNRFLATLLASFVWGILTVIPFLGMLVFCLSVMYTSGYVCQALFMRKSEEAETEPEAEVEAEEQTLEESTDETL